MQTQILWPLLAQVALTFALLFRLGPARIAAIRRGEVRLKNVALGQDAWPERITQLSNSYKSQFELPVLFHLAVVVGLATGKADQALVALAWGFVATRLVHAYIHTTSNEVRWRFNAFLGGALLLLGMWVVLALRLAGFQG